MFFYEVEGHMQKLSSFGRGKKIRPKKSLTWLLHEALQLHQTIFNISDIKMLLDELDVSGIKTAIQTQNTH